ncbi:hypothetical protein MXE38_10430 [Anaerobiospirillum sp. NML120448]|uniref:hypothetical protein n=1 Tax=Anaerobiospirillum sp. NML120448 TaxID=2932816 RepID=UPI001FF30C34|nr:hypothetical protein [Anaerobiospirillum sp. NML120448]MCK0515251.1 hypothetical protein [Anaerobiospirillum sp. NML120448]
MSTAFKFNLLVDGQKVRTLEELRKNFNLEDVLEYFYSGKLQKWLASRDYKHELDQVKDIASSNKLDVSSKLLDIFNIEHDKKELQYFNVDGQQVRTVEELRENFNLEDVLKHFYSGKLQKWLISHDYKHELDQVKDIASSNKKLDVSSKLLDIFKIEYDKKELKHFIDELNQCESIAQQAVVGDSSEQRNTKRTASLSKKATSSTYDKYKRLVDEICMHDHKIDLIKQKIDIIVRKYYKHYLNERLGLIARFTKEAPYAFLAIIDNPKAFNPFLPALLKFNQIIKDPLSTDESKELKALKSTLATLGKNSCFNYVKISDNFSNLRAENIKSQYGYYRECMPCSIHFKHCMQLFSSHSAIEFEYDKPKKKLEFAPLLISDCDVLGQIIFELEEDILLTLDLTNYDISEEQWQLIAERGLTLK